MVSDDPVANVFEVATSEAVIFRDLKIANGVTKTAGDGIILHGVGSAVNEGSRIDNVTVVGMYRNIWLKETLRTVISASYLVSPLFASLEKSNVTVANQDAGDDVITTTTFDSSAGGTTYAILQEAGGGLKIVANKILHHAFGYYLSSYPGSATSDLLITGNSFEGSVRPSCPKAEHAASDRRCVATSQSLTVRLRGSTRHPRSSAWS